MPSTKSSATKHLLPNPHPGEILLEEFLKPMALSQTALANAIGVPPRRINEIVLGKRAVTADTDLRLARYFKMSEGFFLGLQTDYELMERKRQIGTAVHIATQLDDEGYLVEASVDPLVAPYLAGWRKFRSEMAPEWESIEQMVYNPLGFCGTPMSRRSSRCGPCSRPSLPRVPPARPMQPATSPTTASFPRRASPAASRRPIH